MQAFRSDVARSMYKREVAELETRFDMREPQQICCPVKGCDATYDVFERVGGDAPKNLRELRRILKHSHPHHRHIAKITLNGSRRAA